MMLVKFLSNRPALFALAVVVSIFSGAATMGIMFVVFHWLRAPVNDRSLIWTFVALALVAVAGRAVARSLIQRLAWEAILELRTRFAKQTVLAPLSDLERIGSGRLITAMVDEVNRVAGAIPNLALLCANVTFLASCLAYLGWVSTEQLLISLALITAGLVVQHLFLKAATKQFQISRVKWDRMLNTFRGLVDGVKELKLNKRRREQATNRFADHASEVKCSAHRHSMLFGGAASAVHLLFFVILGFAVLDVTGSPEHRTDVRYVIGIIWMLAPLQGLVQEWQALREANVALGRLQELGLRLDSSIAVAMAQGSGGQSTATPFRELQLVGVEHSYGFDAGSGNFTLGPIDLTLNSGEVVFVIGGNGAGKTTLAKLLTGLYRPVAGEIRINGCAVSDSMGEDYRENFSAIFNDFFLFDQLLDDKSPDAHRLVPRLLRQLRMDDRVHLEQGRFSNTTALSLGERKRLALLVAYLEDRPIYVFDEWAADQDPAFKNIFYREILQELRAGGKLVIVISHDDRYFDAADKLLILDRGCAPILRKQPIGENLVES
jgi:putative pyoverdin transport system ATP-binding/permease protein